MFTKITIVACVLAVASAGFLQYQPAALTSTQDNIFRSPGNLAQVSTHSKIIETPFSSSSKSDIRVSNPSIVAHTAPVYGAYGYAAAPAAPIAHAAPAGLLGVAYSPAVAVSHMTYSSPIGVYSY